MVKIVLKICKLFSKQNKHFRYFSGYGFALTHVQNSLRELSSKFARQQIIPKEKEYDNSGEFPWDIVNKAHELGLRNLCVPQQYGGQGFNLFDTCLIVENLNYGCTGIATAIDSGGLALTPVILFGNHEQKKQYLGRMTTTKPMSAAYCVTEPETGSDVANINTRAVKNADGNYVLNGQKMWITNGGVANWYFVLARTDNDPKTPPTKAMTGFIVERDWAGVIVGQKLWNMGQRCADTTSVTFNNVIVPKDNVLAEQGLGFKITIRSLDLIRSVAGASAVGLARRAMDETTKYSLERTAFGVPIHKHQAIQFILADMAVGIETSRLAVQMGCWEYDIGRRNTYWASIAKCMAADVANKCATDAVQVFGGAGFNSEYPVEKLMRDAKILQISEGTAQIQRLIIAREILSKNKQI